MRQYHQYFTEKGQTTTNAEHVPHEEEAPVNNIFTSFCNMVWDIRGGRDSAPSVINSSSPPLT